MDNEKQGQYEIQVVCGFCFKKYCYLFCKGCLMYCSGLAATGVGLSLEPSSLSGPRCMNNNIIISNVFCKHEFIIFISSHLIMVRELGLETFKNIEHGK